MDQEGAAGGGRLHAPGGALEQRAAEVGFEPAQRPRQRRLRLPGGAGGGAQAAVLDHGEEILYLLQRHGVDDGKSWPARFCYWR